MQWLNDVVERLMQRHSGGEIVVSSGVSPSGAYHLGTLREVLTAEVLAREIRRRGGQAHHIHVVDDLDVFRKVPENVSDDFKVYLGKPLCDIPAPDGSDMSYADYYLKDLLEAAKKMHLTMEVWRSHRQYRDGFFVRAIETALDKQSQIQQILEDISGRKLDDTWSPVQIIDNGYLKTRKVLRYDTDRKKLVYRNSDGAETSVSYGQGDVKLNWRIDWPARWWLLKVDGEPFGRDHATKGGSYDTGSAIASEIFDAQPPLPLPYQFINRSGQTRKMSKSTGGVITATELLSLLPPEVVWYFVIRSSPDKQLFFDEGETLIRITDEFGALLAKADKTDEDQQLLALCLEGIETATVSRVPFSHLVASYQAALRDVDKTIEIIGRTEYAEAVTQDSTTIKRELQFIGAWLDKKAPDSVKFSLIDRAALPELSGKQKQFLSDLADEIAAAPGNADGHWFHQTIYNFKATSGLQPSELFQTVYAVLIGQDHGPRAGWFLSLLPRDWLIKRLRLEG